MGFWSRLLGIDSYDPAQRVLPAPYEPYIATGGIPVMDPGTPLEYWIDGTRMEIEGFWRTQPNLRKVIEFIARQVASIPLNAYERVSDTERRRLRGEPIADVLRSPRPRLGGYRFWHGVLSDGLLYDRWGVFPRNTDSGTVELLHIPSWRLRIGTSPLREVEQVRFWVGDLESHDTDWIDIPIEEVVVDYGYAPRTAGMPPVVTLRDVLDENREAVDYRRDLWRNGARVPGQVLRPKEAGPWGKDQRERFVTALRTAFVKDGKNSGGMPLMEDGMRIEKLDIFTPRDAKDIEGRMLTGVEVAAAFHVAPEMIGAREGTFSNVDAFRQMLFGPSLGPYIRALEDALNAQLVPMLAPGRDVYVEANVEAKMRGSFLEQANVIQSATGAPWLTRNEARALQNRPPLTGGDELVVPLNVLTGGQASPRDSGSQNRRSAAPGVKASPISTRSISSMLRSKRCRVRSVGCVDMKGFLVSGLANIAGNEQKGLAISGMTNVSGGNMHGAQISSLMNIAGGINKGLQLTALSNVSVTNKGLQLSGVANYAGDNKGLQVGLANVSNKCSKGGIFV